MNSKRTSGKWLNGAPQPCSRNITELTAYLMNKWTQLEMETRPEAETMPSTGREASMNLFTSPPSSLHPRFPATPPIICMQYLPVPVAPTLDTG